jgi:hypothetical protein
MTTGTTIDNTERLNLMMYQGMSAQSSIHAAKENCTGLARLVHLDQAQGHLKSFLKALDAAAKSPEHPTA